MQIIAAALLSDVQATCSRNQPPATATPTPTAAPTAAPPAAAPAKRQLRQAPTALPAPPQPPLACQPDATVQAEILIRNANSTQLQDTLAKLYQLLVSRGLAAGPTNNSTIDLGSCTPPTADGYGWASVSTQLTVVSSLGSERHFDFEIELLGWGQHHFCDLVVRIRQ